MTKQQRKLVNAIKALYDEHDHSEALLVMATKRDPAGLDGVWAHHDYLERLIINSEALLPYKIVERLKRGEL